MAFRGETYTARPKRPSDGAVSAKYRKKPDKPDKEEEKLAQRLISGRLTARTPTTGQRAAPKKTGERKASAPGKAAAGGAAPRAAQKKTAEKKAPVRRAVMATPKQA